MRRKVWGEHIILEAIEELIQQLSRARINEQAVNIERTYFYKTDKKVNPRQENPFRFFPGSTPILVSAPHAVRHVRDRKIKKSDEYTGSIAHLLNQLTGCHSLTVTKLYGGDPNVDSPCIYKDFVASICREHKIAVVLDLHGAAREHDFDIDIGSIDGQSLLGQTRLLTLLLENITSAGLKNVSQNHFPARRINTITSFTSRELRIPALQLEINRKYRVPGQNPQDFCRLLAGLSRYMNLLKP
jgi:hypothetical protein